MTPLRILAVEDELPNRLLLKAVLSRTSNEMVRDATLLEAPDLTSARRMLRESEIDLVILDVRLPDGVGLDLAREITAADERPIVIIVSASVLDGERELAVQAGADAFIGKPYRPQDLVDRIVELVEARAAAPSR